MNLIYMIFSGANPFADLEKELLVGGNAYKYFDIASFGEEFGAFDGKINTRKTFN